MISYAGGTSRRLDILVEGEIRVTLRGAPARLRRLRMHVPNTTPEFADAVLGLLRQLPTFDQEELQLLWMDKLGLHQQLGPQQRGALAQRGLLQLQLELPLPASSAWQLAHVSKQLQNLSFTVCLEPRNGQACWEPGEVLKSLTGLEALRRVEAAVELSPLAACASELEVLQLGPPPHEVCSRLTLRGVKTLHGMPRLRQLLLCAECQVAPGDEFDFEAVLGSLQQLQEARLSFQQCASNSSLWRCLALLPQLQSLTLGALALSSGEQPALPALAKLRLERGLQLEGAAEQQQGCLAQLLPALRELAAPHSGLAGWAAALTGHPALRTLDLSLPGAAPEAARRQRRSSTGGGPADGGWGQLRLGSCAKLAWATLGGVPLGAAGALLLELGCCPALEDLVLEVLAAPQQGQPQQGQPPQGQPQGQPQAQPQQGQPQNEAALQQLFLGVRALAEGAAGMSLQSCSIVSSGRGLPLELAVPLVSGGSEIHTVGLDALLQRLPEGPEAHGVGIEEVGALVLEELQQMGLHDVELLAVGASEDGGGYVVHVSVDDGAHTVVCSIKK